jgi:hypothetical protein
VSRNKNRVETRQRQTRDEGNKRQDERDCTEYPSESEEREVKGRDALGIPGVPSEL